jgi:SAM-dependent methyltransferase
MITDMSDYFAGRKLYGDDFTNEQLHVWYDGEKEGYAGEVLANQGEYRYHYHELNRFHLFGRADIPRGAHAVGLGSAYGHEFLPIADRLSKITIIDPSDEFAAHGALGKTPLEYRKPALDGKLDFADNHFQLATSMGALHHIANVSAVLREFYRCLAPNGYMLVREPIVTQGDWRQPRRGLTKNERGIPHALIKKIATDAGFRIEHAALFDFAPFTRVMADLGTPAFTSAVATRVDRLLSLAFSFNTKYHRTKVIERFGPASLAMVLRKPLEKA